MLNTMKSTLLRRGMLIGAVLLLGVSAARANPPAPDGLVYGMVRDQFGNPLVSSADTVILRASDGTLLTAPIRPGLAIGVNFALSVPFDTGLTLKRYAANVLTTGMPFTLYVQVSGTTNLPIEMAKVGTITVNPDAQLRQNLTLGVDANGDGIPDAWENMFLAAVGTNLPLAQINVNADYAKTGRTLAQEYQLGNYPNDPTNSFNVSLISVQAGAAVLGFTAVSGRTYTAYGSSDLANWTPLSFTIPAQGTNGAVYTSYYASSVASLQIQTIPPTNAPAVGFFRLQLQ